MIPGLPKFGQKARNLAPFLAAMAAFVGPSAAQSFDDVESAYREYLDRPSLYFYELIQPYLPYYVTAVRRAACSPVPFG